MLHTKGQPPKDKYCMSPLISEAHNQDQGTQKCCQGLWSYVLVSIVYQICKIKNKLQKASGVDCKRAQTIIEQRT